ncbi:centrosomal protein kizuna isoform X2 [Lepisosteus oculatus]|uniref:centrosomal protein kizuna isoform X2 n=1 Tax=Lepisosteus oculatus TaxID=7918 RepID=UPI0035F51EC4
MARVFTVGALTTGVNKTALRRRARLRGAPVGSMALSEKQYLERTGALQRNLHEGEKKRLELERELFTYCRSDRISQIKNTKLRCYLKEICERENQAKIRNLQFLKDFQHIELHLKTLVPDYSTLYQKKAKMLPGSMHNNATLHLAQGLHQPATIFMGRQTSRVFNGEMSPMKPSLQPADCISNQYPLSLQELDCKLSSKANVTAKGAECFTGLSDEVRSSRNFNTNRSVPIKNENSVPSASGSILGPVSSPNLEHMASHVIVNAPDKRVPSQTSVGQRESNSPFSRNSDLSTDIMKKSHHESGRCVPHVDLHKTESGKVNHNNVDLENGPQNPVPNAAINMERLENETADTDSDLTVSLSEDGDPSGLLESGGDKDLDSSKIDTWKSPKQVVTGTERNVEHKNGISESAVQSLRCKSYVKTKDEDLLPEGLVHLMKSIEERLHQREKYLELYKTMSISKEKLNALISLCNHKACLNEEDLEACGAVVLHQLQRLSWSTSKGCLLPEEIVSGNWNTVEERKIRSCLPPDSALLWECWYKHALILEDCHILTTDEIIDLFTPLLVSENSSNISKAKALLKTLLPQMSEGSLSIQSNESSRSLPSILNDSCEIKQAKPAQWLYSTVIGKQELQSGEEDSKEESLVESIPIRETKEYQLLKQSAVQHGRQTSIEEDGLSDTEMSGLTHETVKKEEAFESKINSTSHQESPLFGDEGKKKTISAVKSKAFWGESDDSNTDIEAALRPQIHSTNSDDFDDFYD